MSARAAAVLTSRLLSRKGGASGFARGNREDGIIEFAEKRKRRSPPAASVRLSFKLDRARHQSLRIAAAKLGCGNSELIAAALDRYLRTAIPSAVSESCACLAQVFGAAATDPAAETP